MDSGLNPAAVSGRQGHTVQVMLNHYSGRRTSADQAAADHLGEMIFGTEPWTPTPKNSPIGMSDYGAHFSVPTTTEWNAMTNDAAQSATRHLCSEGVLGHHETALLGYNNSYWYLNALLDEAACWPTSLSNAPWTGG